MTMKIVGKFDICIVGAGPAGLATLSAIKEPYSLDLMTDDVINRASRQIKSRESNTVCVVDPHPTWLHGWKRNFDELDIKFLRSPALAHPNAFDQNALLAYAECSGRTNELVDSGCCDDLPSLLPLGQSQIGLWKLPSTSLFTDFCQDMANNLCHEYVCGSVVDIINNNPTSGTGLFRVLLKDGSCLIADKIVLALGAIGKPSIPRGLVDAPEKHVVQWNHSKPVLPQDCSASRSYLVMGGGLTAVQSAQRELNQGHHVVLCSRRPLRQSHFDLQVEWFDRRSLQKCMADFYHLPVDERLLIIEHARGGGSIPRLYFDDLQSWQGKGRLECVMGDAEFTASDPTGKLLVNICGKEYKFDKILLACGVERDCTESPLIKKLVDRWSLDVVKGFPLVNEDLEWREGFYVAGMLASLNIGPDAANLMGARKSANVIANAMSCRCWLRDNDILTNRFSAFSEDSDEESDDE